MPKNLSSAVELGRRIRKAREGRSFQVRRVADLAGVSTQQIRRIEAGQAEASAVTIARIARALGSSCDEFLDHVKTVEEIVEERWAENGLPERLAGSADADFMARRVILESMGLWRD